MWITAQTHVGQKRSANQDTYVAQQQDGAGFLLVCDGMGGEQGGAVASEIAAAVASQSILNNIKSTMSEISIRRLLESAGAAANAAVFDRSLEDPSLKGMGTTLVSAVVINGCAHFIHAGDSRAYLLRDDFLTQLTVDHTVVQMMGEGRDHPERRAAPSSAPLHHPRRRRLPAGSVRHLFHRPVARRLPPFVQRRPLQLYNQRGSLRPVLGSGQNPRHLNPDRQGKPERRRRQHHGGALRHAGRGGGQWITTSAKKSRADTRSPS